MKLKGILQLLSEQRNSRTSATFDSCPIKAPSSEEEHRSGVGLGSEGWIWDQG